MVDRLVQTHQADKHCKGFSTWDQLIAMIYAQLSGAHSLRSLTAGFNRQSAHHYHLGTATISRSTLAQANATRSPEVFADIARHLMATAGRRLRQERQELLCLIDSTSFTLKGRGFDAWTSAQQTRNTQGLKLHLAYHAHQQLPQHHSFTAPNVNDIDEGRKVPIESGATYVFDKGYCDYNWWADLTAQKARFITRFKRNAAVKDVQALPLPTPNPAGILEDAKVRFAYRRSGGKGKRLNHYTEDLRRIVVHRPEHATPLVLATNDLTSPAEEIAQYYRDRWQIELFFKWIKQHLRLKHFLGRSEGAVRIQILTALITYLLLVLYRQAQGASLSLWVFFCELQASLFQRPALEVDYYRRRTQRQQLINSLQPRLI